MSRLIWPVLICAVIIGALYWMLGRELDSERSKRVELEAEKMISRYPGYYGELQIDSIIIYYQSSDSMGLPLEPGTIKIKESWRTPDSLLAVPPKDWQLDIDTTIIYDSSEVTE